MPEKYTYLLVDFLCIVFPFAFSFHPKISFYQKWKYFLLPCIFTAVFFIVWDIVFTVKGVWSFNPSYVVGIFWFKLPLEEYLFFLCIPYSCVFTYYVFRQWVKVKWSDVVTYRVTMVVILFLIMIGVTHLSNWYTSVTFLLLAAWLGGLLLAKVNYLPLFFCSYLVLLIPFFLSNGVLTGSFFGRVVVAYNNDYNLGVRMLTIPFEDTFYGMLLVLMNVTGFEWLKQRGVRKIW